MTVEKVLKNRLSHIDELDLDQEELSKFSFSSESQD